MSTLLKALKKAEQDRREKLAAAAPASSTPSPPEQLSLPVDEFSVAADAGVAVQAAVRPRINPLLVPAPVAKAPARFSSAAVVVAVSAVVVIAANLLYRPAPPVATNVPLLAAAPAASGSQARLTLDTVTIPRTLLGAGPDPLQLQLDRRADLKLARNSGVAR